MYKIAKPLILHCQTPLHAGTGSDLGYIDLPIQREKHTGFPKVEASSLKGALREIFEGEQEIEYPSKEKPTIVKEGVELAFGPNGDKIEHAAALGFTDARLLLFPIKSLKGIFAWVTCPKVLEKFQYELKEVCGLEKDLNLDKCSIDNEDNVLLTENSIIKTSNDKVILEDYVFTVSPDKNISNLAQTLENLLNINNLKHRLVVVSDQTFTDFVKLHTEVIARIKINNETGVTDNLFNEEFLPAESVLYSLVLASSIFQPESQKGIFKKNGTEQEDYNNLLSYFNAGIKKRNFQLGGDATLGKGIIKPTFILE